MPGKQMSYVLNSDFTAAESVWYVTRIETDPEQKSLFARIDGWSSQDSKDASETPIGNKTYRIDNSSGDYDSYFDESVLDDSGKTVISQIFAYADALNDTNGLSFFDSASDI